MAKRVADTQLTKDGMNGSDGDGFSVGSQIGGQQRATAAQLAQRRLMKPKGSRRPGLARPAPAPSHMQQQQALPSTFGQNGTNVFGGTPQQPPTFSFGQQTNGSQDTQTSASFPPFEGNSNNLNTGTNNSFTAPTASGFTFSGGQSNLVHNPFSSTASVPNQNIGFQGSLFSLPPSTLKPTKEDEERSYQESQKAPQWAAGSPFHNSQHPDGVSALDKLTGTGAASPNLFSQSTQQSEQKQASNNPFGQGSNQQPGNMFVQTPNKPTSNIFGQTPSLPTSNLFGQSKEEHPTQPITNIFGHLQQPHTQPQSNPFSQSSSIFQKPQIPQTTSNLFSHLGTPQPSSNIFGQARQTQEQQPPHSAGPSDQSMMSTSPDTSPQGRPFGFLNQAVSQPQTSPTKGADASSSNGRPFDRMKMPESSKISDAQETPTIASSTAPAPAPGGSLFERIAAADKGSNGQDSTTKAPQASLSHDIMQPPSSVNASAGGPASPTKTSTNPFGNLEFPQTPQPSPDSGESAMPTKASSALFSALKMPQNSHPSSASGSTAAVKPSSNLFGNLKVPQTPQQSSSLTPSSFSPTPRPTKAQPATTSTTKYTKPATFSTTMPANTSASSRATSVRQWGHPPSVPDHFTEEEKRQVITGWRLKCLEKSSYARYQQPMNEVERTRLKDYHEREKHAIIAAHGDTIAKPGQKRGADESEDRAAPGKKARTTSPQKGTSLSSFTNGSTPSSSQTSAIFKNIMNGASASKANVVSNGVTNQNSPLLGTQQRAGLVDFERNTSNGNRNITSASPSSTKQPIPNGVPASAPNPPSFQVPKFGTGAPVNFMEQFSKNLSEAEKRKRKAEEFDSDEDDEAAWEREYEEKEKAKRQKFEEERKANSATFVNGKMVWAADLDKKSGTNKTSQRPPGPAESPASVLSRPYSALTNGTNIFGHLSGEESGAEGSRTGDADDEDEDDEEDGSAKPADILGGGLSDRVEKPKANPFSFTPANTGPATSNPTSNIFGKHPLSTPSQNVFGTKSPIKAPAEDTDRSPKEDHTWKPEEPIKFGTSTETPAVNITSPSPSKPAFGGLFGASKVSNSEAPSKPTPNLFNITPAKSPSVGFGFGFTPTNAAIQTLAPPGQTESVVSSRATSPGITTGESANESNADEDNEPKEEQLDLTAGGPGEEMEDVVFQVKGKALTFDSQEKKWPVKGVGPFRVLKHKGTGKARMLMRQEPSGRILLNSALGQQLRYESPDSKAVRIPIVNAAGTIESWVVRTGKDEDAKRLARVLEEHKSA